MTVLEAVNIILSTAGLGQVANLESNQRSDASYAERTLNEVELRVQKIGWNYNTREDVELTPDGDSKIEVPTGVIWIDSHGSHAWRNITQVGSRLFDRDNNTSNFTGTLRVRYVLRFDFDCIPHPVADYIAAEAAYEFARRHGPRFIQPHQVGFVVAHARDLRNRARNDARRYEADTANINLLDTPNVRAVEGARFDEAVRVSDIRGTP